MTTDAPTLHHSEEVVLPGHRFPLQPGVEFTVTMVGSRSKRMAFRSFTCNGAVQWIDAWDGRQVRSVRLDRVRTVHRTRKLHLAPAS